MAYRILVVEDEEDISSLIKHVLTDDGYMVEVCEDGLSALDAVRRNPPDLMLLDIMLPKMDGKEVCRVVRRDYSFPILILSAKSDEMDKVIGLEIGADDYIAKPFGILELTARIRSAIRRAYSGKPNRYEILRAGDLVMDKVKHEVRVKDRIVDLRPREYSLLEVLLANKGRVMDRNTLLETIWNEDEYIDAGTVDVHVRRLRANLEEFPDKPRYVLTVRGVGYKLAEE